MSGDNSDVPSAESGTSNPSNRILSVAISRTEKVVDSSLFARSYIRYFVTTTYQCGEVKIQEQMLRRFREFDILRQYLAVKHPFVVVPPLPEKKLMLDIDDPTVIRQRITALETFLERCLAHPILSQDSGLRSFLLEPLNSSGEIAAKANDTPYFQLVGGVSDPQLQAVDSVALESGKILRQMLSSIQKIAAIQKRSSEQLASIAESLREWSLIDRDIADALAISSGKCDSLAEDEAYHREAQSERFTRVLTEAALSFDTMRQVVHRGNNATMLSGEPRGSSLATYLLSGGSTAEPSADPAIDQQQREHAEAVRQAIATEVSHVNGQLDSSSREAWQECTTESLAHIRKSLSAWLQVKETFQAAAEEAKEDL